MHYSYIYSQFVLTTCFLTLYCNPYFFSRIQHFYISCLFTFYRILAINSCYMYHVATILSNVYRLFGIAWLDLLPCKRHYCHAWKRIWPHECGITCCRKICQCLKHAAITICLLKYLIAPPGLMSLCSSGTNFVMHFMTFLLIS